MTDPETEGHSARRSVPVWDIFVRVTHWSVAVLVLAEMTVLDDDWAVHRWAGYVVLALVLLRLVWGLIGPRYARFSAFPASLRAARAHLAGLFRGLFGRRSEPHLSHNPLGALMAYNLWASLIVVCVTGILISSFDFWGDEAVAGLHEVVSNWVLISVGLHLAGIAFDTWYSKVNLVRAMINGRKEIPGSEE